MNIQKHKACLSFYVYNVQRYLVPLGSVCNTSKCILNAIHPAIG